MGNSNRKEEEKEKKVEEEEQPKIVYAPLASDKHGIIEEARKLNLVQPNGSYQLQSQLPRARLLQYQSDSIKIRRCPDKCVVLVVGSNLSGKSNSVNHLFGPQVGIKLSDAADDDLDGQDRFVQEYILKVDNPDFEVGKLTLSAIDTPGLGQELLDNQHDIKTMYAVKNYFKKYQENKYPNLIILVTSILDADLKGEYSSLAKSLKALKRMNLIDTVFPNLISVQTHACSIPPPSDIVKSEWNERHKEHLQTVISESIGMHVPMLFLENDLEQHKLPRSSEEGCYTVLPNGDVQPRNLVYAGNYIFDKNNDNIGKLIFNSCFAYGNRSCFEKGAQVPVKQYKSEDWNSFLKQYEQKTPGLRRKNMKKANSVEQKEERVRSKVLEFTWKEDQGIFDADRVSTMKKNDPKMCWLASQFLVNMGLQTTTTAALYVDPISGLMTPQSKTSTPQKTPRR